MEFCTKCGKPLKATEGLVECSCGFTKILDSKISSTEKIKKPEEKGKGVAEEKETTKGFPNKCKKCGYKYSNVIDLGASYSDEANIYLFKCKKCGNVEREAYGSGNK
jgi:DNA-directed RNA polymerase subunit M/transcription elongation factor TFIIS